jgi:hypothetical protein
MSETNYQRYFGTPEKAAEMLEKVAACRACHLFHTDTCGLSGTCAGAWLTWLESEAE